MTELGQAERTVAGFISLVAPSSPTSFCGGNTAWTNLTLERLSIDNDGLIHLYIPQTARCFPFNHAHLNAYLFVSALEKTLRKGVKRMERIPSAQPPPLSKHQVDVSDVQG